MSFRFSRLIGLLLCMSFIVACQAKPLSNEVSQVEDNALTTEESYSFEIGNFETDALKLLDFTPDEVLTFARVHGLTQRELDELLTTRHEEEALQAYIDSGQAQADFDAGVESYQEVLEIIVSNALPDFEEGWGSEEYLNIFYYEGFYDELEAFRSQYAGMVSEQSLMDFDNLVLTFKDYEEYLKTLY